MIPWLHLASLVFPLSAASSDMGSVCAIDMESNSFKLTIGEMKDGSYLQHHFASDRLGVGDDVSKTGFISPSKLKEIRQTLESYLAICDSKGIQTRAAVATAAFREASNQGKVAEIARSLHLPFEVVSEERESQLAYTVGTLGKRDFAVIRNGSRTIELVTRVTTGYEWKVFHLGYRIAFQQFFEPARTLAAAEDWYRKALAPYLRSAGFKKNRAGYAGVGMKMWPDTFSLRIAWTTFWVLPSSSVGSPAVTHLRGTV